jgi:hypothetical protein
MVCHCGPTALLIFFKIFSALNYYFFSVFESFLYHDVKIRLCFKKNILFWYILSEKHFKKQSLPHFQTTPKSI